MSKYTLVGFLNVFGDYPDFVYPIFRRYSKYYFQNPNSQDIIETFIEIDRDIKFITMTDIKCKLQVNDKAIYAFQVDEDNILWGERIKLYNRLSGFTFEDYISEYVYEFSQIDLIPPPDLSVKSIRKSYEALEEQMPYVSRVAEPRIVYEMPSTLDIHRKDFNDLNTQELNVIKARILKISLQIVELISSIEAMNKYYPDDMTYNILEQMQSIYGKKLELVDREIKRRSLIPPKS